jgi:hypothetical protein
MLRLIYLFDRRGRLDHRQNQTIGTPLARSAVSIAESPSQSRRGPDHHVSGLRYFFGVSPRKAGESWYDPFGGWLLNARRAGNRGNSKRRLKTTPVLG